MKQISDLKDRILNKKKKYESDLTPIIDMIRGLGCFSDVIGRDFEVLNNSGEVIYTIRQKPITISQLKHLMEEFNILKRLDAEQEAAKWKTK